MNDTKAVVPPVGYIPKEESTYPQGETDSQVYLVFARRKHTWSVESIWLRVLDAEKAARKFKKHPTRIVSVYVPGLIYTAAAKLRHLTTEATPPPNLMRPSDERFGVLTDERSRQREQAAKREREGR